MLSHLAELRSQPDHVGDGGSMATDETGVSERLRKLTKEVDLQFAKCTSILHARDPAKIEAADLELVGQVLAEYEKDVALIVKKFEEFEEGWRNGGPSAATITASLRKLFGLMPVTPQRDPTAAPAAGADNQRFVTPISLKKATPKSAARSDHIDFDAFPTTPTLEQLGISHKALALVGDIKARPAGRSSLREKWSAASSDLECDVNLRQSISSLPASVASNLDGVGKPTALNYLAPLVTNMRTSSSFGSQPHLATRLSDLTVRSGPLTENLSSTPTVTKMADTSSPFGMHAFMESSKSNVFVHRDDSSAMDGEHF